MAARETLTMVDAIIKAAGRRTPDFREAADACALALGRICGEYGIEMGPRLKRAQVAYKAAKETKKN